ncbi:MAG: LamG domain-containing protein, partial [Candidatus Promineifilaceae bacterium]
MKHKSLFTLMAMFIYASAMMGADSPFPQLYSQMFPALHQLGVELREILALPDPDTPLLVYGVSDPAVAEAFPGIGEGALNGTQLDMIDIVIGSLRLGSEAQFNTLDLRAEVSTLELATELNLSAQEMFGLDGGMIGIPFLFSDPDAWYVEPETHYYVARFNGVSDAALISANNLVPWDDPFTLSFIVRPAAIQASTAPALPLLSWIVDKNEQAVLSYLDEPHPNTGQLQLQVGKNSVLIERPIDDGEFHYVVITSNANVLSIYIDGVLEGTLLTREMPTVAALLIGANTSGTEYFGGEIGAIAWSGELFSAEQITLNTIATGGLTAPTPLDSATQTPTPTPTATATATAQTSTIPAPPALPTNIPTLTPLPPTATISATATLSATNTPTSTQTETRAATSLRNTSHTAHSTATHQYRIRQQEPICTP